MQEPTWRDVFTYIVSGFIHGEWPIARWVLAYLALASVSALVRFTWARHRRHQQIALVASIMKRWTDELGMPFHLLSAQRQLQAVERLGDRLVGDRSLVLALLVQMRVQMEEMPVDERVLQAMDGLASASQEKLSPARRRRYRRLRGLDVGEIPTGVGKAKS